MQPTLVSIDPQWAAGLFLALTRVGGFVVASPLISPSIPRTGRLAFTVAIGVSLAAPVDAVDSVARLLGSALVNVALGVALGWLTGVVFMLFSVAGRVVDFGSGLALSQVLDPMTGDQSAVFGRLFPLTALTLFIVSGGLPVLVSGLDRSVRAIPLDGRIVVDPDLLDLGIAQVSELMRTGVELALPLSATLLVAEVLLGLAGRFVPKFNVFLLGLPAKIWISLAVLMLLVLQFPAVTANLIEHVDRGFTLVLAGLGGGR